MTSSITPRNPVLPRLHPKTEVQRAIDGNDLRADAIVQSIAFYAVEEDWQGLWNLADSLKREVSVLFDEQGLIWVDIGSAGRVAMSPPTGSRIPFQLWIHTHPWDAYWSMTDKETLGIASGILEKALVLGHNHLVRTIHHDDESLDSSGSRLATDGPLMHWTAEAAMSYATLREAKV
jgi:uncharacterized membrane protein